MDKSRSGENDKTARCYHCSTTFRYHFFHAGFGDEHFFYCDHCGKVATIDWYTEQYTPFYEKFISPNGYDSQKPGELERFERDSRAMKSAIIQRLKLCSCGGRFAVDAMPRCPSCKRELEWNRFFDPIDKDSRPPHYFRDSVKKGWQDIYYFVFNDRVVRNPWKL